MAERKRKKPAARKPAARKEVPEATETPAVMVAPLSPQAFQMVIQLIDQAPIKGGDAGNIIMLKRELARVANAKTSGQ